MGIAILAQLNVIPASQVCISVSFLLKNLKYDIFFKSFYHAALQLKTVSPKDTYMFH